MIGCRAYLRAISVAAAILAALPAASEPAATGCSRPIRVAASPMGRFMTISLDGVVGGWEAEFLGRIARDNHCTLAYVQVSRARALELMKAAEIDILPAAIHTEERDRYARFVHTDRGLPLLLTLSPRWAGLRSSADVIASGLRLDIVRAADYGLRFRALLADPAMQGRVTEDVDNVTMARRLKAGDTDAALAAAPVFAEAAVGAGIADGMIVVRLDDLPPVDGGEYVVERALPAADAVLLERAIGEAGARHEFETIVRHDDRPPAWAKAGFVFEDGAR